MNTNKVKYSSWTPAEDQILLNSNSNILAHLRLGRTAMACAARRKNLKVDGKVGVVTNSISLKKAQRIYNAEIKLANGNENQKVQSPAVKLNNNAIQKVAPVTLSAAKKLTISMDNDFTVLNIGDYEITVPNTLELKMSGNKFSFDKK